MIKQLSVFLENTPGRLARLTQVLADAQVDLLAISVADTSSFGVVRAIVDDYDRALAAVKAAGFTAHSTVVLAVSVCDVPGGLHRVLGTLREASVNVEYLYSFIRQNKKDPLILMKVDHPEDATRVLTDAGMVPLEQNDLV